MTAPTVAGLVLVGMGVALFLAALRLKDRWARSGGLMVALTGYFVVFATLMWKADAGSPGLSLSLLVGSAAMFRLMGWFEAPPPKP